MSTLYKNKFDKKEFTEEDLDTELETEGSGDEEQETESNENVQDIQTEKMEGGFQLVDDTATGGKLLQGTISVKIPVDADFDLEDFQDQLSAFLDSVSDEDEEDDSEPVDPYADLEEFNDEDDLEEEVEGNFENENYGEEDLQDGKSQVKNILEKSIQVVDKGSKKVLLTVDMTGKSDADIEKYKNSDLKKAIANNKISNYEVMVKESKKKVQGKI